MILTHAEVSKGQLAYRYKTVDIATLLTRKRSTFFTKERPDHVLQTQTRLRGPRLDP